MNIIQKIANKFGYVKRTNKIRIANYAAGHIDRLTAGFVGSGLSADRQIQTSLRVLRERSRQLAMNNVYMRKFLKSLVVNVIGHEGITLQNQAKDDNGLFDDVANKLIESHWADFSREGVCDVTGEYSLHELLCLALESCARDGEAYIRVIRGWHNNKYRIALQLLEGDMLDENYNESLKNGNKIIMGVEKDKWGRRVRYYFLTEHPGDYSFAGRNYIVVDARDIIPLVWADRINQTRGVPWAHAAILQLNNIGAYTEAAIINARIGASKMGFYTSDDDIGMVADEEDNGNFIEQIEPGIIGKLPKGWEFKEFNPQYPSGEFENFVKSMLRGVSAGLLTAYSTISCDLADVNFSSIRSGKIDERDIYKLIQKWFIQKTVNKIFPIWLDTALMVGAIKFEATGKALPYSKFAKFNMATWQPKGFDWVSPLDDIEADIRAIEYGLKTKSEVVAERGKDLRDIYEQLRREQELAREYDLSFSFGKTEAAAKEKKNIEEGSNE